MAAILAVGLWGLKAEAQQGTLLLPSAVAYDATGDLFFVDTNRHQVFEVTVAGSLTVIAGSGVQGFAGDGGLATDAELNGPRGIAVGGDGTVYVADTGNQRVRAIIGGQIATVVGTGVPGYVGDGGPAIAARLSTPTALTIDGKGNLLVCDTANHRVRRIAGGLITTVVGNGTQGFSGDGAAAVDAELDSPEGVAVMGDGRVVVADSHNQRLRVVGIDGVIGTIAGSEMAGYSGDGGAATAAKLSFPRGVSADAAGDILFADSNNQRIREINPLGVITTIAGSGVQGFTPDGVVGTAAALNTPRAVAAGGVGTTAFTDTPNRLVREIAVNGELYTVAVLAAARSSNVTMTIAATVYRQAGATVVVSGKASIPLGSVAISEGGVRLASAGLSGGKAVAALTVLSTGPHVLTASYSGDAVNPAASSVPVAVMISPASVVATANATTVAYGDMIPQIAGTSTGILPQDARQVGVTFSTIAVPLDAVGIYPITASLSGAASSNYSLSLSALSGALSIVRAGSRTAVQPITQTSYAGLPLVLTADVGPVTSGVPTGEVDFSDAGAVVGKAVVVNGVASATYLAPAQGSHTLIATYLGDGNFLGSVSSATVASVGAMPDFSLAAGVASEAVQGGLVASYPISLTSVGGVFTGNVVFSVSGLQPGATASFSPASLVPGAAGASTTLSVQTKALSMVEMPVGDRGVVLWCLGMPLIAFGVMRRRRDGWLGIVVLGILALGLNGCGARTVSSGVERTQSYALTVTATSTNLAGAIVSHTTLVTLTVE